jgi:hypothetical protein
MLSKKALWRLVCYWESGFGVWLAGVTAWSTTLLRTPIAYVMRGFSGATRPE